MKLNPCGCGCRNLFIKPITGASSYGTRVIGFTVTCQDCHAQGPDSPTRDGAAAKWNAQHPA